MPPACRLCGSGGGWGGALRKGTVAPASTSVWEKAVPPPLTLILDNSVPPCMSLMPFNLLPLCWSPEGVSSSKWCKPFKRNRDSGSFCLPQPQSLLVFLARSSGHLSSWHWNPGVGLGPLTPEILLPIFIHHMWVRDQPVPCLHPSYQSGCSLFFNSVVGGLPFSLISDSLNDGGSVVQL